MDFENEAVCEKIINEIDLVFQNDTDLYGLGVYKPVVVFLCDYVSLS